VNPIVAIRVIASVLDRGSKNYGPGKGVTRRAEAQSLKGRERDGFLGRGRQLGHLEERCKLPSRVFLYFIETKWLFMTVQLSLAINSCVGAMIEYQPRGGDALRLGSKGMYCSCVGGR